MDWQHVLRELLRRKAANGEVVTKRPAENPSAVRARYAATLVVPWKAGRSGSQMKRIRGNAMSATA